MIGKDQCMQLVLDTTSDKMNILEYLKTEMLEEKRVEKEGGGGTSIVSLFDRDISLKIEVLEDGTARAVPESALHLEKPPKVAQGVLEKDRGGRKDKESKLTRPKNYACTHCGTAFVSTKDLARHTVVHTGEKVGAIDSLTSPRICANAGVSLISIFLQPYSCPYCDQKFTAPSSRATHIRSIHEKSQVNLTERLDTCFMNDCRSFSVLNVTNHSTRKVTWYVDHPTPFSI